MFPKLSTVRVGERSTNLQNGLLWEVGAGMRIRDVHDTIAARLLLAFACVAGSIGALAPSAQAIGPPLIAAGWVTDVTANTAVLRATVNPNGLGTSVSFEYIADAAFQANLNAVPPREGFSGASKAAAAAGGGLEWNRHVVGLAPVTAYHYRPVAINSAGPAIGPAHTLRTEEATNVVPPLDNRGWELVSPVDKNGGSIQGFGQSFGGGVFQAAAGGNALTYSSTASFGPDPRGAPVASQYLTRRGAGGWSVENITTPLLSGSYGDRPDGVPYQLFSGDLSLGLMLNGQRCRGSEGECPVANPPLPGSGAPPGYMNYYLRNNNAGSFSGLLREADVAGLALSPARFDLGFAGTSPDLAHVVLSTCAALTVNSIEVPAPGGCAPSKQNLYERSGAGLVLLNLKPGEAVGTPGATLAAQAGAISADGSRIYWTDGEDLYLRDGAQTKQVDDEQGGGGTFETASTNGSVAFFTKAVAGATHLFLYLAATDTATDLTTPGAEVLGVLGAAADGSRVYYATAGGLELWRDGVTTEVAPGAAAVNPGSFPPATGTARVTPDGAHLAFLSPTELTGYENFGFPEVFLYGPPPGGGEATLTCVSCNATGERPEGAASIPGAVANGTGPTATRAYKPRVLSDDGSRVFFESADDVTRPDSNKAVDVFEWEANGSGSCRSSGGCLGSVSGGRGPEDSSLVDASADGADVFFLTEKSLVPQDPGSYDLYDFRVNGGFPAPEVPIPCVADACQSLPEAPEDPTPGTLVPNGGNPPLRFVKSHKKRHQKKKHHKGKHGQKQHRRGGGR
jgi:hypothetical protein